MRLHHERPWCSHISLAQWLKTRRFFKKNVYINIWNACLPSWNLQNFGPTLNIPSRASRCEVKLVSRAFGSWGWRCCFALDIEADLGAVRDPRIHRFARQPVWIERRRDGGLTDTSNFLMQPFCNSREETGCSPFYPMNQHDPIFAYKPSQLSLLPLAPNNGDGLIIEFTSFTFLPRRGTGFVHEATCCGVPRPCKKWGNRNESEWWSKLCLSFRDGTFLQIICTRRWINRY